MATEWTERPIGELAEIFDGPHATPPKTNNGPIFLGISNLAHGRLDLSEVEYLSEHDFKRWTRRIVPTENDVVFSYETRLGEAALIPKGLRCCLGRRMGLLRARPGKADPRFLLYAYLGVEFQETLRARTVPGSTVDRIPLIELPNFPIRAPADVGEQKAIARILGAFDDKIELNQRMNKTLEAMARALFKSWFVDFDPVRAKAEGRDPNVPKSLEDSFPTSFEDSALGDIPKGWRAEPLAEITSVITKGTTPTKGDVGDASDGRTKINYIRVNAIEENGTILLDKLIPIPESVHLGILKRSVLRVNDVLYTIAGTIGRIAIVDDTLLPANTNQAVAIIRPKPTVPSDFLALTMQQAAFRDDLHSNIVHAVQANLSLGMLSTARAIVPPLEVLPTLFRPIQILLKRLYANRAESRTLAAIRDTLLPKLISGELRVEDAEKFLEARL